LIVRVRAERVHDRPKTNKDVLEVIHVVSYV
jgi:hypothetical protein